MEETWFETITKIFDHLEEKRLLHEFRQLRSNRDRIQWIHQHRHERIEQTLNNYRERAGGRRNKSDTDAIYYRKKGNDAFVKKDLDQAAEFYRMSMALAPVNSSDMALAYGNLSAVLFEWHLYRDTLQAIQIAYELYPEDLKLKLSLRRASSYCRLNQKNECLAELEVCRQRLDRMSSHDQTKFSKEIDQIAGQIVESRPPMTTDQSEVSVEQSVSLYHGAHQHISSASSSLRLAYSEEKGRHLIAMETIPKDALLIKERPYACLLPSELSMIYCDTCLTRLIVPYACPRCCDVLFCSEACRDRALNSYHRYECSQMSILKDLGIAFLAYRTLTITDHSTIRLAVQQSLSSRSSETYGSDYVSILQLITHSESMSAEDLFHYSLTAYFLGELLESISTLPCDRIDLGSLFLTHLSQMICNAQRVSIGCVNNSETDVASAILPVCALMNHSCLPNIRCDYHQGYYHVYARRSIDQGEEIFNCYGPEKSLIPSTKERQKLLFDQYFFKCQCEGCRPVKSPVSSIP